MNPGSDNAESGEQTAADVERIRDIIFGSQMRQYDQHFKRVTNQMEALRKQVDELRTAFEQDQAGQQDRTRELQQEARKLQGELRKVVDELRSDLSGRLEQHGADTQSQFRQLIADTRQQSQELRSEFAAALKDLEAEVANRHDLGNLLVEMGMRLKNEGGITQLLEQLEQEVPPAE